MSLNLEVPYNQAAGLYLPLTGGALTGPLALGANKITGLANGTATTDAATYGQVQTTEAALNPALQYNDLLGWTFDPVGALSNNTPYGGNDRVTLGRIPLPAAMTITNVLAVVTGLGTVCVNSFLALYKSDGTVIGQSADQSTAWKTGGATGLYTLPLVGGPYLCTPLAPNDFLWAGLYVGSCVSGVNFATNQGGGTGFNTSTISRARFAYYVLGNTPTLTSFTPSTLNFANLGYWFGLS
jgi:hypothetical protein